MPRTIPIGHEPVGDDLNRRPVPGLPGVTVAVSDLATADFDPDTVAVKAYSLTANMVATLGYGSFASTVGTNWSFYLYDFLASQSLVDESNDIVDATVYGVGFRLLLKGQGITGSASYSAGGMAASATLEATKTYTQLLPIGLGPVTWDFVTKLGPMQEFDLDTMFTLGEATGEVVDYLASDPDGIDPKAVSVVLNDLAVETAATSYGFALRRIQDGHDRQYAEEAAANELPTGVEISDAVIRSTYTAIQGQDSPNDVPDDSQTSLAYKLTHTGP
jgi:hypothetical protein